MPLMRSLQVVKATFAFSLRARHLPGVLNVVADGLSRNRPLAKMRRLSADGAWNGEGPVRDVDVAGALQDQLAVAGLESAVSGYAALGIAASTRRAYRSCETQFARFCRQLGLAPMPASEQLLSLFCASLANEGKAYSTTKSYLAGVRHWQVVCGLGDPFAAAHPQLDLVLRGIKRRQGGPLPDRRLPITPTVLRLLRDSWERAGDLWDAHMLWAASCCGFFGFLRSGEFTVDGVFDPLRHLAAADVSVDDWGAPSWVRIHLK